MMKKEPIIGNAKRPSGSVEVYLDRNGCMTVFDRTGGAGQIVEIRKAIEAMGVNFDKIEFESWCG